ncbi:uncharacterized protein LOC120146441 [Hibiscus syriacus]|uniref:uncharacterized protein LOC120146441 n=1 Tax=Hibiscus syriacus TaxID=106335 RepID=UPI0019238CFA|nr:uncharacterized protein LOC120146441 [Hibiscus syriacus]
MGPWWDVGCWGFDLVLGLELWGIYDGLCLTWNLGNKKIQCQTDCAEAHGLITSSSAHSSHLTLIRMIANLVCGIVSLTLIFREANAVADHLAKLRLITDGSMQVFQDIPPLVSSLLYGDIQGPPYLRNPSSNM